MADPAQPSPPQLAASPAFQALSLDQQVRALSLLDPDYRAMDPVEQRKAASGLIAASRAKKPARFSATYKPFQPGGKTAYDEARFGPQPARPSFRTALEQTAAGPTAGSGFPESAAESLLQPVAALGLSAEKIPSFVAQGLKNFRQARSGPLPTNPEALVSPVLGPPTGLPTGEQAASAVGLGPAVRQVRAGNYSGAAGTALGAAAQLTAPLLLRGAEGSLPALRAAAKVTPAEIAERASPRILAAANEAKSAIHAAIEQAKANAEPLYRNLHAVDEAAIQQTGAAGSVNVASAKRILDEASQKIFGRTAYPKPVVKAGGELEPFIAGEEPLATLQEARNLRSDLRGMETAARAKADFQTAATISSARKELTASMRSRAQALGLEEDFDLADAKWRQMRETEERLAPLLNSDSDKFFAGFEKASPETRQALDDLASAGLKQERIRQLARQVHVQRRAAGTIPMTFPERMRHGVLPAAGAILVARKLGLPLSGVLASPFLAGYLLGPPISDIFARRAALEGLAELPELARATPGLGPATVSQARKLPPAPPGGGAPGAVPSGGGRFGTPPPVEGPFAGQERALRQLPSLRTTQPGPYIPRSGLVQADVPIELRPGPLEKPLEQALGEILRMPGLATAQQAALGESLAGELAKAGEKARARARVAEAVRPFRPGVGASPKLQRLLPSPKPAELAKKPKGTLPPVTSPKPNALEIYNSLPRAVRDSIDREEAAIRQEPDILRRETLRGLRTYAGGFSGARVKELLARREVAEGRAAPVGALSPGEAARVKKLQAARARTLNRFASPGEIVPHVHGTRYER